MKSHILFSIIFITSLNAHVNSIKEDTITSGNWNEYNPSFARNTFYNSSFEWLVYERQTDDSSFISAKKFLKISGTWDSAEVIISRSAKIELQKYPDISSKENYSITAWQKRMGGTWNIFYSTYSSLSQKWSSPLAITNDTLNNVNVRVQPIYPDSQFVFAWQNKNVIHLKKYPFNFVGVNDTVAISNSDSTAFDFGTESFSQSGAILYTLKTPTKISAVSVGFTYYPTFSLKAPDTVPFFSIILQPRFVQSYYSAQRIVFEMKGTLTIARDIYLYNIKSFYGANNPIRITDSEKNYVAYRNARAYFNPIITMPSENAIQNITPYNHVIVFECISMADTTGNTSVIIMQQGLTDSIGSNGYNRNPIVGANPFYSIKENKAVVPVVWESNRSGKNHLYGKNAISGIPDWVLETEQFVQHFSLLQNYPNPFNPNTTINYQIPKNSFVTLKVYDLLGREISTLVDKELNAGSYSYDFQASHFGLTSGIYFYQLRAGEFVQTKKMLLLK